MHLGVLVRILSCLVQEFMSPYVSKEEVLEECSDNGKSWSNFWYPPGSAKSKDPVDGNGYKLLDVNLTHPIRTTQLAIAHFLEKKKPGNILHVSSIAGQIANPVTPLVHSTNVSIENMES